jgi:hypothetical protein
LRSASASASIAIPANDLQLKALLERNWNYWICFLGRLASRLSHSVPIALAANVQTRTAQGLQSGWPFLRGSWSSCSVETDALQGGNCYVNCYVKLSLHSVSIWL